MTDARTIIKAFGGQTAMAQKTGWTLARIKSWSHRNEFPPAMFPALIRAAKEHGVKGVTMQGLYAMKEGAK